MDFAAISVNQRVQATRTGFGGGVGAAAGAEELGREAPIIKGEVYVVESVDRQANTFAVRAYIEYTGRMERFWVTATDFQEFTTQGIK